MKKRIYFTIETKVREFYSRMLFSVLAAERGYSVVIGSRGHFFRFKDKLKKGIFLSNGNTIRLSYISAIFKKLGFKIGHLDEEGAITFNYEHHIWRYDFELFKKIDFFFCGGEREKKAILSNNLTGNPEKKIVVTGNTRFDLLKENFLNLYESDKKKIKEKYGNFILITTKFNKINIIKKKKNMDWLQATINSGYIRRDCDKYFAEESVKNDEKTKTELENFLINIDKNFPNTKFLLKPHPGENYGYWKNFKNKIKQDNLVIIPVNEHHTNAYILACDFMIASNCTTLLEAYMLKKLGINFLPYDNVKTHYELPKAISMNCYSINQLVEDIKGIIETRKFSRKELSDKEKDFLSFSISNKHDSSSNKMLDYIEKIKIDDNTTDKFTIYSFISIYKIKEIFIQFLNKYIREDLYLSNKQEYALQKNPGITKSEITNIKDKICNLLNLDNKKIIIKALLPGLYSIEKNN
jgi:surface carbohydrate biosynthesis protein